MKDDLQRTSGLREDAGGAVFVEKLIVYIPMMLMFFLTWELAELGAASLVVQRACSAAGRAAVVVLPDDPIFYEDEPVGSYDGRRREDIELAAGMVLSAIPKLTSEFEVEVSHPPPADGIIEVSVVAPYDCTGISLICGLDDSIELSATSRHAYQGAKYPYGAPAGGVSGVVAGLSEHDGSTQSGPSLGADDSGGAEGVSVGGTSMAAAGPTYRAGGRGRGRSPSPEPCGPPNLNQCNPGDGLNNDPRYLDGTLPATAKPQRHVGVRLRGAYGADPLSLEALKYRCRLGRTAGSDNVAVLLYRCADGSGGYIPASSSDSRAHSERAVLAKFAEFNTTQRNTCAISELYTEREPCTEQCAGLLLDNNLGRVTSWHFNYNVRNSYDPTLDPYYNAFRRDCTRPNRFFKEANPTGFNNCQSLQRWANDLNLTASQTREVSNCLRYKQVIEDSKTLLDNSRASVDQKSKDEISSTAARECPRIADTRPVTWAAPPSLSVIEGKIRKVQAEIARLEMQLNRPKTPYENETRRINAAIRLRQAYSEERRLQREKERLGG